MPVPAFLLAAAVAGGAVPLTGGTPVHLSATQLFDFAEQAKAAGRTDAATRALEALTHDPDVEIRTEARFRLAMLLLGAGKDRNAAVLFRQVLDERPKATRVRLELAHVLAKMGDESSARRELRAVRTGTLPPEVAQMVDRFSAALRARKPFGGSLQVSIASDSNINRATRSDTLGTVIGDFVLNDDAKARSGKGLAADGVAYGRLPLGQHALLASLSGSADLYRKKDFNDVSVAAKAGPELRLGSDRLNLSAGLRRRWYGGDKFTTAVGTEVDFTHPLHAIAQLRGNASAYKVTNHRNALESGWNLIGTASVEAALSRRSGAGLALTGIRQALRDRGYSTMSGQLTLFGYHELGKMTVTASGSISHLEADRRLFLYPERRKEWLYRGSVGATFRQITYGGFAPTAQFTAERNRSSIELYDYRRAAFELGVTRAF
jgi:hypothetical protein